MSGKGKPGAADAGPDVAAVLRAGEDAERARRRRAAMAGLAGVALAVGLALLAREALRPSLVDLVREERAGWTRSQIIAPAGEPAGGEEQILPSDRFGISADSEPPGAEVWVGEQRIGETPLAAEVACQPGEPLAVRFRLRGRPDRRLSTPCREQGLVRLRARW